MASETSLAPLVDCEPGVGLGGAGVCGAGAGGIARRGAARRTAGADRRYQPPIPRPPWTLALLPVSSWRRPPQRSRPVPPNMPHAHTPTPRPSPPPRSDCL